MKRLLTFFLLSPVTLLAQETTSSIHFEHDITWTQVKAKARAEHKYIFVDCYATWCGPCKMMDRDVYPNDSIGGLVNPRFISVKIQLDSSKTDNAEVRSWYLDARQIAFDNKITALPTFLFLSPEGEVVHKGIGYKRIQDFAILTDEALHPETQYVALLKSYSEGKKNYSVMPFLAGTARQFGKSDLALAIAVDYQQNYLDKLPDEAFGTKDNFRFFSNYKDKLGSGDRVFNWCLKKSAFVDSVSESAGYSNWLSNYIIYKEELITQFAPAEKTGKTPDWNKIAKSIRQKYGESYVEANVLKGKVNWYKSVKDWKNYSKYQVAKLEKDSIEYVPKNTMGVMYLNNSAFDIFRHSDEKTELETAVRWSDLAIHIPKTPGGDLLDTKANLLYKLGRKEEALELEKQAMEISPNNKDVQEAYQKMLAGKPTW